MAHTWNGEYDGTEAERISFPLGGIGAGMLALRGNGSLGDPAFRHHPGFGQDPFLFAALRVEGQAHARVLEGPLPGWMVQRSNQHPVYPDASGCMVNTKYGFPRFACSTFQPRFPFATAKLTQPGLSLGVEVTGWSPFIPGNSDDSCLPVAALEYRFTAPADRPVQAVFSFHAENVMLADGATPGSYGMRADARGFTAWQAALPDRPEARGELSIGVVGDEDPVRVDAAWFRGGWYDAPTMLWKTIEAGMPPEGPREHVSGSPSSGGSLYVPLSLAPGATRTIRVVLAWHVPDSNLRWGLDLHGKDLCCCVGDPKGIPAFRPWYATRFPDSAAVATYAEREYGRLRAETAMFSDCFFASTLPPEVLEAVAANLCILKSTTILRQADGRLWAWEGSGCRHGSCAGSCTHVWNYAQAMAHLFPDLERTLRQTEFHEAQDERGHQSFRSWLPTRPVTDHGAHAAADGQLGGILKVYRDWRISGDTEWLRGLWPRVRQSLLYGIATWDPDGTGLPVEPHHNTYDIEFWGHDPMTAGFYLGALAAAVCMAAALGDDPAPFAARLARAREAAMALFNGEYFEQHVRWKGLHAGDPTTAQALVKVEYSPEAQVLLDAEGPKYQVGTGCLADGMLGLWLATQCGLDEELLVVEAVRSHLDAVHRHNLQRDLSDFPNPQRPGFALGTEGGLVLCTWPRGRAPALPFVYSNEVWTGIEYQVASHLIGHGRVEAGCEIVRVARQRYDGRIRNPFAECELGSSYGRALSSYALLQAFSGARYDAVTRTLHLSPAVPGDFACFLATAGGFGLAGVRDGKPFFDVRHGQVPVAQVEYRPASCER